MTATPTTPQGFGYLVDDLVRTTPGVRCALVASSDGLLVYSAGGLDRDLADPLAANVCGLMAQANSIATFSKASGCQQAITRFTDGSAWLVMAINSAARLAVFVAAGAKVIPVSERMSVFIGAAGHALTPVLRDELIKLLPPAKARP